MKSCSKCGEAKPEAEFHKDLRWSGGLRAQCKTCEAKYREVNREKIRLAKAARYELNRVDILSREAEKRESCPGRHRESHLKNRYGLTTVEFEDLLRGQSGKCKLCETSFSGNGIWGPRIDHDHASGDIRGLLCHSCNVGIGLLKESPEILQRAIKYLTEDLPRQETDKDWAWAMTAL